MEKYFITYNQALALKELGFDEECLCYFNTGDSYHDLGTKDWWCLPENDFQYALPAPLKSQVFEWARREHGLWVSFNYDEDESEELYWYVDKILKYGIGRLFFHDLIEYDTYEEAESACIDKLIELLK